MNTLKSFMDGIDNNPDVIADTVNYVAGELYRVPYPEEIREAIKSFQDNNHLLEEWSHNTSPAWNTIRQFLENEMGGRYEHSDRN